MNLDQKTHESVSRAELADQQDLEADINLANTNFATDSSALAVPQTLADLPNINISDVGKLFSQAIARQTADERAPDIIEELKSDTVSTADVYRALVKLGVKPEYAVEVIRNKVIETRRAAEQLYHHASAKTSFSQIRSAVLNVFLNEFKAKGVDCIVKRDRIEEKKLTSFIGGRFTANTGKVLLEIQDVGALFNKMKLFLHDSRALDIYSNIEEALKKFCEYCTCGFATPEISFHNNEILTSMIEVIHSDTATDD